MALGCHYRGLETDTRGPQIFGQCCRLLTRWRGQASASDDNTVQLWNATIGARKRTLEGHSSSVKAVAFSPDGKVLASASNDNTVRLWNATTGAWKQTLEGHSDFVKCCSLFTRYQGRCINFICDSGIPLPGPGNRHSRAIAILSRLFPTPPTVVKATAASGSVALWHKKRQNGAVQRGSQRGLP